jgi:hypothetical protein
MTADFLLQSNWMALGKSRPAPLLSHSFTHFLTSWVFLWDISLWPLCLSIGFVHTLLDFSKQKIGPSWGPFVADQALHIVSITAAAWLFGRFGLLDSYKIAPAFYKAQIFISGISVTVLGIFYFLFKFSPGFPFDKKRAGIEKGLRGILFLLVALLHFSWFFLPAALLAALAHLLFSLKDKAPLRTFISIFGTVATGLLALWALNLLPAC